MPLSIELKLSEKTGHTKLCDPITYYPSTSLAILTASLASLP